MKEYYTIFKNAFKRLKRNDPLRLAAATAFFTTFALPFILLILINIFGWVFGRRIVSGSIFAELKDMIGAESAAQVQEILENVEARGENWLLAVLGSVFLLFVSTTIFIVIQNSINQLWNLKEKSRVGLKKTLKDRGVSLAIIVFSGLLFLVALLSDALVNLMGELIAEVLPRLDQPFIYAGHKLIYFALLVVWFAMIYRYLPNARVAWKAVWWGALLTGFLFGVGEFVLTRLLVGGDISSIYGTGASIVLVLLFVFYSSFILYYGASFVKAYAEYFGLPTRPRPYVTPYKVVELEP